MDLALVGQALRAVLLSSLLLALWESQAAATWSCRTQSEPQQHLTCPLNQTEGEAQFEGDLMRTSGPRWQVQKAFPEKVTSQQASGRGKERPKVVANPQTEHALEGEDVILVCESHSQPSIGYWDWYRHHDEGDVLLVNGTEQRVFITESAHRSELLLRHLGTSEDVGQYICVGTNSEGYHAVVVLLKVRSHMAALWPFLGIVLEVLVLFTIILLNERSRTLAEELPDD